MKALLLKSKHWVLFILMFGVPFVFQLIFMFATLVKAFMLDEIEIESFLRSFTPFYIIYGFSFLLYIAWMFAIGLGVRKHIPENLRLNPGFFVFALIFPVIFLVLYVTFILNTIMTSIDQFSDELPFNPALLIILVPAILFLVFCSFYSFWFTAKTLKTAQLQRKVHFSDYIGEFFMFWFYPIGIWFIQPQVNKLTENGPDQPANKE